MFRIKYRHEYNETEPIFVDEKPQKVYWGTVCKIFNGETLIASRTALLNPKDQFSRRTGRAVAFYKALKSIEDKEIRRQVAGYVDEVFLAEGRKLTRNV